MKKLLFIIICAAFISGAGGAPAARADGQSYAQALSRTAYFFEDKDESTSLFAVPYTYCVSVVRDDGQWYYARYAEDEGIYRAVYGYVLKRDFVLVDDPPPATYLFKSITVVYTAGESDPSLPALDEIEMQAAFYGTYYSGATAYSYVLCGGNFGYIEGTGGDYPLNELPSDKEEEKEESGGGGAAAAAVLIVVLAAAVMILIYLSSSKKRRE